MKPKATLCGFIGRVVFGNFFETTIRPYLIGILMSVSSLHARLELLNRQLTKVSAEINGKLDELREALENADQLPAEVDALLSDIQFSVDQLDAIVPDAVEPDPVDPPVEPTPEEPQV